MEQIKHVTANDPGLKPKCPRNTPGEFQPACQWHEPRFLVSKSCFRSVFQSPDAMYGIPKYPFDQAAGLQYVLMCSYPWTCMFHPTRTGYHVGCRIYPWITSSEPLPSSVYWPPTTTNENFSVPCRFTSFNSNIGHVELPRKREKRFPHIGLPFIGLFLPDIFLRIQGHAPQISSAPVDT